MRVQPEAVLRVVTTILRRAGSDPTEAQFVADHLVDACLAGHDSHGVIRVLPYVSAVKNGQLFPNRHVSVLSETDSIAMLDGNFAYGQIAAREATDIGIAKARASGLAMVTLRGSGHLGRIGAWAEQAAAAGQATIYFVNSARPGGSQLAPFGGSDRRLNAGPICLGMPVKDTDPIVLDISTSSVAMGKIRLARNMGTRLREACIIDAQGNLTDDPNALYGPPVGAVLPFGAHKGYGLCVFTDLFSGVLSGAPPVYRGEECEWYPLNNLFAIHIDIAKLGDAAAMGEQIRDYADWVTSSPPRRPGERVQMPGEAERRTRAERRKGLEIDDATWRQVIHAGELFCMSEQDIDELMNVDATPG